MVGLTLTDTFPQVMVPSWTPDVNVIEGGVLSIPTDTFPKVEHPLLAVTVT